jgi:hypothetical protein
MLALASYAYEYFEDTGEVGKGKNEYLSCRKEPYNSVLHSSKGIGSM